MRRTYISLAGLASLAGLGGCYSDAYVEPSPVYQTTVAEVPYQEAPPVTVSIAPPPPRYETIITCGYGTQWIPGRWDWNNTWYWSRGYCAAARPGYVYVAPRYVGGVYYRAHWSSGGGYVAPPAATYAPAYRPGGTYVPPPAPGYAPGRPAYVAPAPTYQPAPPPRPMGGTYVTPPTPGSSNYVHPGPVYQPAPTYQPAPPPRPMGGTYVTPPTPGSSNYVQPAQPVYRPVQPAQPVYSQPMARPVQPAQPAYGGQPVARPVQPAQPAYGQPTARPAQPAQPAYGQPTARPAQPSSSPPAYRPAQPANNNRFGAPPPR